MQGNDLGRLFGYGEFCGNLSLLFAQLVKQRRC